MPAYAEPESPPDIVAVRERGMMIRLNYERPAVQTAGLSHFLLSGTLSAGSFRRCYAPVQILPKLFIGNCTFYPGSTSLAVIYLLR
jgi:hypothetical protein